MTVTVQAPGGVSIDFPDGTDEDTIRKVMLRATGGDGNSAAPGPPAKPTSTAEAMVRGGLQGVTFGTSDEIYAGAKGAYDMLKGGSFGPTYERELAGVRSANERARSSNPVAYIGGEFAGGMALPFGVLGTAARGANMAQRSMQSAKTGAAIGGAYGFGTAEGGEGTLGEQAGRRLTEALPSALLGGAVGAAAPAAVDVASAALRYPANAIRAVRDPSAAADVKVGEALARDMPGQPIQSMLRMDRRLASAQQTKPEVMLADVGGENTRNLLRAAANMPSKNAERLRKRVDQRQAWQWSRIESDVAETLADGNAFAKTMDDVAQRLKDVGKKEFDLAFSRPWNVTANSDLARLIQRPYMAKLVEKTDENIMGMTGESRAALKPWEFLHRVKMQIDREIGATKRGLPNNNAGWDLRDLVQLKRELVDAMGKHNGPYRMALYKYGDEAGIRNALEQGFDEFKSASPDQLRKTLSGLSEPERRMYRVGAARSLFDDIERGNVTRDRTDSLFSSPAIQMKLSALYPDQAMRREMQRRLVLEAKMADTRKAVQSNSTTAKQLAQGVEGGQEIDAAKAAAYATSGNLQPALQWLSRQMQVFNGMTPQVSDKVIERLMSKQTTQGPLPSLHTSRLLAAINKAATEPDKRDAIVRRIILAAGPLSSEATRVRQPQM